MRKKAADLRIKSVSNADATVTLNQGEILVVFNTMKGYTFAFDPKDPVNFELILPTDRPGKPPRIRGEIAMVEGLDDQLQKVLFTAAAG